MKAGKNFLSFTKIWMHLNIGAAVLKILTFEIRRVLLINDSFSCFHVIILEMLLRFNCSNVHQKVNENQHHLDFCLFFSRS